MTNRTKSKKAAKNGGNCRNPASSIQTLLATIASTVAHPKKSVSDKSVTRTETETPTQKAASRTPCRITNGATPAMMSANRSARASGKISNLPVGNATKDNKQVMDAIIDAMIKRCATCDGIMSGINQFAHAAVNGDDRSIGPRGLFRMPAFGR